MKISDCKPGAAVVYYPVKGGPGFRGVVREEPWQLGDGSWVTHLHQMEDAYRGGEKKTVYAAWVDMLKLIAS